MQVKIISRWKIAIDCTKRALIDNGCQHQNDRSRLKMSSHLIRTRKSSKNALVRANAGKRDK